MSPTTDLQTFNHITQYIATALTSGVYDKIPQCHSPSPQDVRRLNEAWRLHWDTHRRETLQLFGRQRRPSNQEIKSIISNLHQHTFEISDDPSAAGVTEHDLRIVVPDLKESVSAFLAAPTFQPFGQVDAEVLALCTWFKNDYMRWVDPIKCLDCGGPTYGAGSVAPSEEERRDGAGRVELHVCKGENCGTHTRFPRYGKVKTLLSTRVGRCGEWAHLFYVFMRLKGIESRYIWNSEDHVWCEYWSPALQHWVHVDACEGTTNKPLVYALGWGKRQAFCLAFGRLGAEDVTRAYVNDYEGDCRSRRRAKQWKEKELRRELYLQTIPLRLKMSPQERSRADAMDQIQALWLADTEGRLQDARRMELGGRVSGPDDWKKMRDEMGLDTTPIKKPSYKVLDTLEATRSSMRVFGDAHYDRETIVLTTASSQTAAVFHPRPVCQSDSFVCDIAFRLSAPSGAGEADGIGLVFSPEPRLGLGGYGLGYSGLGGEGDFAVEVDTYRTQDFADDPPTPHISIHSPPNAHHRHSLACTAPGSIPHLSDGRDYKLQILYDGRRRNVKGYLEVLSSDQREEELISLFDITLPLGANRDWFIGVTGSCGGLWQKQEVLDWRIAKVIFEESQRPSPSIPVVTDRDQ